MLLPYVTNEMASERLFFVKFQIKGRFYEVVAYFRRFKRIDLDFEEKQHPLPLFSLT